MPDLFDQLDVFDEVEVNRGTEIVPRETPAVPQDDQKPRLRREAFKMMRDNDRLSPAVMRNVADESSGLIGGTARRGKNLLGRGAEKFSYGLGLLTEKAGLGKNSPEARSMNEIFETNDLIDARNKTDTKLTDGSYDGTISNFVRYFEGNGITDGKEMMAILKDSIAENEWDSSTDDNARVLSDGTLRVNPKFVALPDAQEGIKVINASNVPQEVKDAEIAEFQQARKITARELDKQAKSYDEDYRKYAEQKAAEGVTDPEEVFFKWPGLDRGWIKGSWDVVRDTVANAGRGIANTGRGIAAGAAEKAGLDNIAAGFGRSILESREKQGFTHAIAAARGQDGPVTGSAKELGTTVLEMAPMFAGGWGARILAGTEAGAARQILGKIAAGSSVYGYAGAQGYASLMQTALQEAEDKARQEGRELTGQEINDTVEKFQGAALANGFQTAILSKLLPEGAEKTAIQGLTARAGTMTGREVLEAVGEKGIRAAKDDLLQFAKQAYAAGKVGFKDEALEEGVNQYLEGLITKLSGADADKTWDEIGQETFKGTWMGGVVGGGLPVAQQTLAKQDPNELIARGLAAGAQDGAPAAAAAAMETLDPDEERIPQPETGGLPPEAPEVQNELPAAGSQGEAPQTLEAPAVPATPVGGEPLADIFDELDPTEPALPATGDTVPADSPAVGEGAQGTDAPQRLGSEADATEVPAIESPPLAPANPNAYSRENLAKTFDLTPDQAEATDTLVKAMGLDTSQILLKKGGTPGKGILRQEATPDRIAATLPDADKQAAAAGMGFDSWTPEAAQTFTQRISDWLVSGKPDALEPVFRKVLDSDKNLLQDQRSQGIKGSFERLATSGKTLLRGLTNPDVSTGIHELSHVARQALFDRDNPQAGITPEDIQVAEDWAGAKDGKWSEKAEEKFARGFEKYLRDGEAPDARLAEVFAKIADWFRSIYQTLAGSPIDVQISPEMKAVFDRLVTRGSLPEGAPPATAPAPSEVVEKESTDSRVSNSEEGSPPAGGATPEDDPKLTSTKNVATDKELERMGFAPIAAPARKALGTSWDEAQKVVADNPDAGSDLVNELNRDPRALHDDVENGVLLAELAKRKADFGKAQDAYVKAVKSEDTKAIEDALTSLETARNQVYAAITAAKATGTAWGRSGRFRQLFIDEDFSLVALENRLRKEGNGGEPLTEKQAQQVKALVDRIEKVEKELEEARRKIAEDEARRVHESEEAARKKVRPKVRKALSPKIEAARKRLIEQGFLRQDEPPGEFLAQEALPEQALEDLATIGASWMVDKDIGLRNFSNRVKKTFGDKISPHAAAIYAKAREILGAESDAAIAPMEAAPRKRKSREQVIEGLDAEGDEPTGADIFQLARAHINAGVEGFENVMNAVLADLQAVYPDLTLRRLHDIYSGYGKTVFPKPDDDLRKLREYRQLARLTSQLEDASKKLAPMRTGLQRDKATEKVRSLQKEVKAMMRQMGIKAKGSRSLTTALDAIKNRLRNEIEELQAAIDARTPKPEKGQPTAYDAEAVRLKEERDAKQAEYDTIFPKGEPSEDQLIEAVEKSLDRRIAADEKLIQQGLAKKPKDPKDRDAWSQGISERRARLKDLREQRDALRDADAERLERNKKLVQSRIDKIRKRIAEQDYAPAVKRDPVVPDEELERLQLEEFQAKRDINEKILMARRANRTTLEKVRDNSLDALQVLGRALMTSFDLGHFGRQGGLVNFARPEVTLRHLKDLFTFSEKGADKAQMKMEGTTPQEKSLFKRAKDSGLSLTEWRPGHKLNDMEEAFKSQLAKKIPGVAASERAYVTYMNAIRFDYFNLLAKALPDPTPANLKELAIHVNNLTGRGSLDVKLLRINLENSASNLALLLFSPKYWASRLRVAGNALVLPLEVAARGIGMDFRRKEIRDARKIIAKEYGRMAIGGSAFYGLIGIAAMIAKALAGDDEEPLFKVGTDTTSSDFGKLVFRNGSRSDPMAGMSQNIVFLSRMLTGKSTNTAGETVDLDDDPRNSRGLVAMRMLRSKLAPLPGVLANLAFKRDMQYKPTRWEKELLGMYIPISAAETINGFNELGFTGGTVAAIAGFFGSGVNTYGEGVEDADVREDILTKIFQVDPARYEK